MREAEPWAVREFVMLHHEELQPYRAAYLLGSAFSEAKTIS